MHVPVQGVRMFHACPCRTLSNTVPTYLEAMQHIVFSMEQIDSASDIEAFVGKHTSLMELQPVPPFEQHPISVRIEQVSTRCMGVQLQCLVCSDRPEPFLRQRSAPNASTQSPLVMSRRMVQLLLVPRKRRIKRT